MRDRAGGRLGRRGHGDVARRDRSTRRHDRGLLRAAALCRCLRGGQARAAAGRRADRRNRRCAARRYADRAIRERRRARVSRTRDRDTGVGSRRRRADVEPADVATRSAAVARTHRRSLGQRSLRGSPPPRSGRPSARADERTQSRHRSHGHRAVARVCLFHRARRTDAGREALRRVVDERTRTRRGIRSGWCVRQCHADAAAGRVGPRRDRRTRSTARALWRHRCIRAPRPAVELVRQERDRAARNDGAHPAVDLSGGRRVPHQRDAGAAGLDRTRRDRPAESLRLLRAPPSPGITRNSSLQ